MVRETRHLWVGNLPLSIREDRILDHFKRYGKVQSVKILPKKDEDGACATVAFIDIKSAAKAHNADNKIEERTLKTDYYEPPASSTAASAIFIHERDDALVVRNAAPPPPPPSTAYATSRNARYGLPEDRNYERPGHYYERVNDREPYLRRPVGMGYHDEDSYQGRAKSRDRYVRSTSGSTYAEGTERSQNHFRAHNARQIFEQARYSEQYSDERDVSATTPRLNRRTNNASASSVVSSVSSSPPARSESRPRRTKRRSPSQSPSASRSNSPSRSRSRSSSGSRSSSSSSKLRSSSSDSSGRSWSPSKSRSPVAPYGNQSNAKRLERPSSAIANPSNMTSYMPSSISSSAINCTSSSVTNSQSPAPHQSGSSASSCTAVQPPPPPPPPADGLSEKEEKKPLGICVRNLPVRSTDTSLKDGLFHEYKKHGKVTIVKVIGQGTDRYAVVCFKKPEDVEKALEVSKDKQFFGCKIEVTAHEGLDADDNEFRPLEAELDEYHPKATRTLFIGNLEKDITTAELRKHFDQFGEIIEIDIKKQGSATSYAFIQYSDIASVVKAMRKLDGENLGANRIKLGFGKSMPTNCVWLDGIVDAVSEKYLARHFSRFGVVAYCAIDWEKGHALIFYDSMEFAQIAVSEMRGRILNGKKLQVDFASRECQTTFFDKLEMTGQMVPGDRPWERRERRGTEFDIVRNDDRDARVGFDRVYNRYDGQTRTNRGNFRGIQRTGFCGRGRGQNFSNRYETFYDEFGERRHRYNSREESGESSSFEGKGDRLKYSEPLDCNNRKWNKLRNSISDQESHHSQSPPHSRHQSRSTSPVSKERKSLKDRLHHHIKSPGSHSSSQLNSPCREPAAEELPETEFKDFRAKNCDGKLELCDSDVTLPLASPKNSLLHDGVDKVNMKPDGDVFRRRSIESENLEEISPTPEQLSQLERKRRLLAASVNKDSGIGAKLAGDRQKLKNSTSHSTTNKFVQSNCIPDCVSDEKSDVESSEPNEENIKDKTRSGNSANTDLKYLQKKQVHILQLLDQLRDGVNANDIEGTVENERYLQKKKRSLSCMESMYSESDISKAVTKDEYTSQLLKSGLKDQNTLSKNLNKSDTIDSNNCFSVSLDSFVFRKHLDPRKLDHYALNSLPKCHRLSLDKDELSNNHGSGDSLTCDPSWKKQSHESNLTNSEGSDAQTKVKHEISDSCLNSQKLHLSADVVKAGRSYPEPPLEMKRERDISPLSLPLPKFAASLRSPKSSPSTMTSPKSVAQVPHLLHSPNPHGCSKNTKPSDISADSHHERKVKELCADEKVNGIAVSSATSSPSDFHSQSEVSDGIYLETIQSPKNNSEKCKDVTLSSDSDLSPISSPSRPSIEDRIKALDEKFNAWSGCTRAASNVVADVSPAAVIDMPKCGLKRSRFTFLPSEVRTEPSDIVKSLLSKSTIFDQDSMRLQHIDEKYEPLNVKTNVSLKGKPAFRTKAAAKEFSSAIVPPLQTIGVTVQSKTPTTIASHIVSSPSHSSLSAMTNAVSIASPSLSHFSQVYTPHSPCVVPFSSTKEGEENSFSSAAQTTCGDQAGLSPYVPLKIKSEPIMAPSLEPVPHALASDAAPLNIKKEPATPQNIQAIKEEEEHKVCCKKEIPVANVLCNPSGKDFPLTFKNEEICKSESANEPARESLEKPSMDFQDSCGHWKETEAVDDTGEDGNKSNLNLDFSDLKLEAPAAKKRVSSLDSSESESGKSCKSLEVIRECHDSAWSKQEKDKHETKVTEPECKRQKVSLPHSTRNHSPTHVSTSSHKKSDKKEKNPKPEKSRINSSKKSSCTPAPEKEEDGKVAKSESKEKCKSDNYKMKEEKKSKPREHKDSSSRGEEKNKSIEKQNSEKINKSSSRNVKNKKDSPGNRSEKPKSDKKSGEKKQSKSKTKQEFELPMDEEPVYFSMYDKVKARSSKQQTMKHQAKDLETMRQKFSKLKQSRAKREEKSKSIDSDRDSDSASQHSSDSDAKTSKTKQQRKRKLVIESSSDDELPQYSQSRNSKSESKDYSDSPSDSDFDQKSVHKQSSISKSRKKKPDIIESDSSDSELHLSHQKSEPVGKRKFKSKSSQEKSRKLVKSEEGECSDAGINEKSQGKDKDHKRKKVKKAKTHERPLDREGSSKSLSKKSCDDGKSSRKISPKEESLQSDSSLAAKAEGPVKEKSDNSSKEKKVESSAETMEVDGSEDFRSSTRKKKKSKKTPKSKDKRAVSEKRSSEFTNNRKDDESESKSSLPVLLSPRPSSPINDKPLSPPCLKAGDASENDMKTDLSEDDYDIVSGKSSEVCASSDIKPGGSTICNNQKGNKKKETSFSHSKLHSDLFDSHQDQVLTSFPEKGIKTSVGDKELANKSSSRNGENGRKRVLQSSSSKKGKESSYENFHKTKHEKIEEPNIVSLKHTDCKPFTVDSLRDKRRRKMKKPIRDKKWKSKNEEGKDDRHRGNSMSVPPASPLIFDSVSFDDSHLSDIRLDEEIVKEARQLEQELLAVSEETSTFGDDGPTLKKEEKLPERKFEEEAAKEAKRLEDELFSSGRDPWHMKEKPFGPESHSEELCPDGKDIDGESDALVIKDEIFPELALHSSSLGDTTQNENDIFLSSNNSDQYKLEDKDGVSEIDDQRKIEDDLAVSALLQEMNNGDISAPELTKEADYLEPLMTAQPEDTMNYLLPDEGDNSLHIVDHSPELVNENSSGKLDNDGITLSPSSNLEPPSLEISSFEESVALKTYDDSKSATVSEIKSDEHSDSLSKTTVDSTDVVNMECSSPQTETAEATNPPVIDAPSAATIQQVVPENSSPKTPKKSQRKKWLEHSSDNLQQNIAHHSTPSSLSLSELPENNNEKFESSTVSSKDDDNPPILLPVDLQPRPDSETQSRATLLSDKEETKHCSDGVIMHSPALKEEQEPKIEEEKRGQEQDEALSLNDFGDPCGNLAPLNIASFSPDLSEDPVFKIPEVSKEENNEPVDSHASFQSTSVMSDSSNWKAPDADLQTQGTYPCKFSEDKEPSKSPSSLYYPNIFQPTDILSPNQTPIKNDISVIKSTANIVTNNLSNEPIEKSSSDVSYSDMISSGSYLSSVFSSVKDNQAGVIFNTSEIESTNCDITTDLPSLKKDDFSDVKMSKKSEENKPEEPHLEKEITHSSTSNDRFDMLHETPKPPPLHFPPLFTIPTTEPLLSPNNEKLSSCIDEILSPTTKSESAPEKKEEVEVPSVPESTPETSAVEQDNEPVCSEQPVVSLAETLSKMNEHLEGSEGLDKKSRGADVESVSSDTTDITFPDIKTDLEINQVMSGEEQMQEEACAPEKLVIVEQQKSERPRRGRRPKARKLAGASNSSSAHNSNSNSGASVSARGKKNRTVSFERTRRSLRSSDTAEQLINSDKVTSPKNKISPVTPAEQDVEAQKLSVDEQTQLGSARSANRVELSTSREEATEPKAPDKVYNTRAEETKRRRGRKKKPSGDNQNSNVYDKSDTKTDDHSKEFSRPKESHLWLSLPVEKDTRGVKDIIRTDDPYEFHGSDEEATFDGNLQPSVKERLHDSSRTILTVQDSKPDTKLAEAHSEKEKSDTCSVKVPANEEPEPSAKEGATEATQPAKLSISMTIRFQRDGLDGTSTGTAAIVKSSVAPDDVKQDTKAEKTTTSKDTLSTDSSHNGPSKNTRKSTRLMNQAARSNYDEVIAEVSKRNFKSTSHSVEPAPSRVTRRSRASRKSEENITNAYTDTFEDPTDDKNKNEPMFVILDNAVKDVPDGKKSVNAQAVDSTSTSEGNSKPEKNVRSAALLNFRILRSTASKLDSQKENLLSETVHDTDSRKKETSSFTQPEEKKDTSVATQQGKKESSILLPDTVPYRPPLPVLKVKVPRMVLSCGKEPVISSEVKSEENEEDSDSRSSPAFWLDPVTGFLTTESEKKEKPSDNAEISSVEAKCSNNPSAHYPPPISTVATAKIGIKDVKLPKEDKPSAWDQTASVKSSVSVLAGPYSSCPPTSAMKKEGTPHLVPDMQHLPNPDSLCHAMDLKSPSAVRSKTCAHVGVLTPVVINTTSSLDALKAVSSAINHSPAIQCSSTSAMSPAQLPPSNTASSLRHSSTSVVHSSVPSPTCISTSTTANTTTTTTAPTHVSQVRTVVTAVVTVATSESTTSHPLTYPTKTSSSVPLPLSSAIKTEIPPLHANASAQPASDSVPLACTTKGTPAEPHSNSQRWNSSSVKYISSASPAASSSNSSWSSSKLSSQTSVVSEKPTNLSATPASSYPPLSVGKPDARVSQPAHSHSKSSAYFQQLGYHPSMYEAAQNLNANNTGGVIAELLQNPQLLQHKEYHGGTTGTSQFPDRNQSQTIRPSTPGSAGIPSDVAARLGNPTPPHTPTPLVNTSTHSLPQSTDIHNAHVAAGLHLRQMPYALGIPSWEIPYVHNSQIIYAAAAAHPHYAAMHPEFRAQQEAQARASMGITPCLPYPAVPPGTVSPGNFRQPLEPRLAHSADHKSEGKSSSDVPEPSLERRVVHGTKSSRVKKEDLEAKKVHCEEYERPGSAPQSSRLCQEHVHYSPAIRQEERKTDSPVIAKYTTGQVRAMMPDPLKDSKADSAVSLAHSHLVKTDGAERELNPPAAHQAHVSTAYHTFESAAFPGVRQQLLGVPQVPSPTPVFDGRSASQPSHSSNAYLYKKNSHLSQNMSSSEKLIYEEVSKKMLERPLGHQGTSVSPGLGTPQVIQSLNAHPLSQSAHCIVPQNGQMNHRPNAHTAALVMTPPLAPQATNNDADVVNQHPIVWQGLLALKNDEAAVQMHYVFGNLKIATDSLPNHIGIPPTLKISQRMKLDETQLQGVHWKMMNNNEHCILMALPCGTNPSDVVKQSSKLKSGFITYLKQKQAAGIVNIGNGNQQPAFVIHIFPPACDFSESTLTSKAPYLATIISDVTHLVIIITTA